MKQIEQLIEISRKYGQDSRFVIAGGGNTSYKDDERLWVKASGHALATITEDGFAVLDREKMYIISTKQYSTNSSEREAEATEDLMAACITKGRKPSVASASRSDESVLYCLVEMIFIFSRSSTAKPSSVIVASA